jgi:hypothetical protein
MDLLFQSSIVYNCQVHNSGYSLIGDRKLLKHKYKSHIVDKPFSYEAVNDFLSLGNLNTDKDFDEERIRFCNKWGPLTLRLTAIRSDEEMEGGENGATFEKHLSDFQIDIEKINALDFPKRMALEFSWSRNSKGTLIPIVKAPTLYHAIQIAYFLAPKNKEKYRECASDDCNNSFEAKRSNKKYCSETCRARNNMKFVRERKKHVD